ncbi:unnamed protein product [Gongylonema pulchrum]|uniref:Alpha-2-MRAP_N domain-containing protein n=1 Tax=Gongylonema pulchrum TaxID=637853 RepID=A0A183EE22_9BILA|nr:unnamed protein product [Gongylonema pulchrum]
MKIVVTVALLALGVDVALGSSAGAWWMDVSFRVNKLNFIWSKAVHHLADKALIKRLKGELDKFDALYLSAKSRSMKNGELAMEQVDNKLEQLLQKYHLDSTLTAYNKKYKWRNEEEMKKENLVLPTEKFDDPKLQKLWHVAKNSHFSEAALKGYFFHCE